MPKTIRIELYEPHAVQERAHNLPARYRVLSWGRQAGKSTWGNNEALRRAWENRRKVYWYILPTWTQALVQFRRAMFALMTTPQAVLQVSKSELFLQLRSGSFVFYKSGREFENLRTETLDGVIIDEYREQHPDLWPRIIRPMLTTTNGWAAFTSTTNGFDDFYELFQRGKLDTSGKWASLHAPSTANPYFSEAELIECQQTMSEGEFRQEILAEFVELYLGKVYPNYSERNVLDTNPFTYSDSISPHLPIILAPDFNLNPMGWAMGQLKGHDVYWFDEIYREHSNTQDAARGFIDRYKRNGLTQTVVIAGDATSKAGQRAAAGQSDYDILCSMLTEVGIPWENKTPDSNPPVKDRVNAVNAKLLSAAGTIHMWHHSRCKMLARDWMRVKWKETKGLEIDPGPKRDLGHISDGAGYAVHKLSPIPSVYQPGVVRIIRR